MTPAAIPLVLLLAACGGKEDTAAPDDTAPDTGTPVEATLVFEIEGDPAGLALTLDRYVIGEAFADPAVVLAALGVTRARVGVDPPDPPADQLVAIDEKYPDFLAASYFPALHEDPDGDAVHETGERIAALGRVWPLFAQEPIPQAYADLGLVPGWNAVEYAWDGTRDFAVRDVQHIPLPTALRGEDAATLSGTWDLPLPAESRIAVVPWTFLEGDTEVDLLYDEPAAGSWAITLSGTPPADHRIPKKGGLPVEWAWEFLVAYEDADASGSPTTGDVLMGSACVDGLVGSFVHLERTDDLYGAFILTILGDPGGWWAAGFDPDVPMPAPLAEDQTARLSFSKECTLS